MQFECLPAVRLSDHLCAILMPCLTYHPGAPIPHSTPTHEEPGYERSWSTIVLRQLLRASIPAEPFGRQSPLLELRTQSVHSLALSGQRSLVTAQSLQKRAGRSRLALRDGIAMLKETSTSGVHVRNNLRSKRLSVSYPNSTAPLTPLKKPVQNLNITSSSNGNNSGIRRIGGALIRTLTEHLYYHSLLRRQWMLHLLRYSGSRATLDRFHRRLVSSCRSLAVG